MSHIKKLSIIFAVFSLSCFGMQQVIRDNNRYKVWDGKNFHYVKPYDVDSKLRNLNENQLNAFLRAGGKIRVSPLSNGDFVLRAFTPGLGGGPILGMITAVTTYTLTGVATAAAVVGGTIAGGGDVSKGIQLGIFVATSGSAISAAATAAATAAPTV